MFFSKKERKKERRGGGRKRKKFAQKRRTVTRRVTRLRETERRGGREKKKKKPRNRLVVVAVVVNVARASSPLSSMDPRDEKGRRIWDSRIFMLRCFKHRPPFLLLPPSLSLIFSIAKTTTRRSRRRRDGCAGEKTGESLAAMNKRNLPSTLSRKEGVS